MIEYTQVGSRCDKWRKKKDWKAAEKAERDRFGASMADSIRKNREEAGVTIEDAADAIDVDVRKLQRWEKNAASIELGKMISLYHYYWEKLSSIQMV